MATSRWAVGLIGAGWSCRHHGGVGATIVNRCRQKERYDQRSPRAEDGCRPSSGRLRQAVVHRLQVIRHEDPFLRMSTSSNQISPPP